MNLSLHDLLHMFVKSKVLFYFFLNLEKKQSGILVLDVIQQEFLMVIWVIV